MKLKTALHLILILGILILAGAAAGQAAAPISAFDPEEMMPGYIDNSNNDEAFLKNEHLQIKYIFKIIEISKKYQSSMRLNELLYDKNSTGKINFYSNKQILEFIDPVSLNNLKIEYKDENDFSYSIIEPEIIVSLFETASISVNEEILNITEEDEFFRSENKLYLSLFTRNISRDSQLITTEFRLETKENTFLDTTLNIINGKDSLVGMLVLKNNNNINFVPSQTKLYVVYLKAISLKELNKNNNHIINLDGLNNIVSSSIFEEKRNQEKYILIFIGENKSIKSKIVVKNEIALYFEFEENEYAMLGLDKTIFSILNLEINAYTWDKVKYFISLGLNEEVNVNSYFSLGAGLYPIVYETESEKFQKEHYWLNAKIFVFNDKNKIILHYEKRNDKENFRIEFSREFWDKIDLIVANKVTQKRKEEWELGFKWKF